MKKINIFFGWLILLLTISSQLQYAGTTGKIAGKVIDAETKEPLLGVNIVLVGTNLGAASDIDGEFFIINIPPGIYTIKASMVGYNSQSVEQVRIQVDLTTRIDFQLSSTAIQIGQEVMVVAKKVIQKDLTSSERSFQSDQIDELPARDVTSILSLQAGIVKDAGGNLHIRGGRTTEISYMVDGVQVINPINRSAGISIDDQSIEELKAITGTFNAEYGQALSGVVNIVTKKGSEKFSANATVYFGDHLSFDNDLYSLMDNGDWVVAAANALTSKSNRLYYDFSKHGLNSYQQIYQSLQNGDKPWQTKTPYLNSYEPFKSYDAQLNLSGPVPGAEKTISYFIAGRYQYRPGYQSGKRYFMPWGIWDPVMDTLHSYDMPDQKIVPLDWYKGISTQAKIFFNLSDFNISYGIYFNKDHSYGGGQKYLPDGGRHYYTDRSTQILSMTYVFSSATFIDFKGSYYLNDHKSYLYEDPYDYRYMPTKTGDFQEFMFQPTREDDIEVKNNPNDYSYWGNDVGRNKSTSKYLSFNFDLTSQIDKYNMIKFGGSGRFHNLEQDYYTLQFSEIDYKPIIPEKSSAFRTFYSAKPKELAAYVQDKIEFEELIINLGVRFDYFDSDGRILADPRDPQIYSPFKLDHIYKNYSPDLPEDQLIEYTPEEREQFWYKKPKAKYQFSPRFGLSFPITAEGVIHFSYGHFFQNPEFQYLYTNPNFWITGAGAENLVGNADLDAERTVMYEIGLQQQLFDNLFLHVTGFYRDIRDWISTGFPVDTYRGITYYSYINRDHAVAKGITLSANYKFDSFNINVDYTFMNANGTSSDVRDAYNDLSAGRPPRIQLVNLSWDQPHALNAIISYNKDNWNVTLIGTYNSGFPYTPEFTRGELTGSNAAVGLRENSERRPSTFNVDLRLSRTFKFDDWTIQAFCDVTNLLDTRNANYVYADTGLPDYTLQDYLSLTRLVEIGSSSEYFANPGMFTAPRFIQLGLRISFN
ncbi:MAG: TonB-dependent receptor [Bacteroidota bacterium]